MLNKHMDNILEKMLYEQKSEDLNNLNAVKIVNDLFSDLMDRERDVLTRRFGLNGGKGETLEKIGQLHKLTRERVRQIEAASIRKIKKMDSLGTCLSTLKQTIDSLLEEHGGLLRKDYLLDILTVYCLEIGNESQTGQADYEEKKSLYRHHFDFLLSKLMEDDLETVESSDTFHPSYKTKEADVSYLEELADSLLNKVDGLKKTLTTEELLKLLKDLEVFNKYQEKFKDSAGADITPIFKSQTFLDKAELINNNKILYSLMQAIKNLEQNKYGHWGKADWQEIKPKTINDKIYLILKNEGHSLHFTEIADKINEMKFDKKLANPATVHNELILDQRYVLNGRGIYGLKEWTAAK